MPVLSIIVPVFNVGILVMRCLDSLVNQSFKDIEIIVINDCSTDGSEKLIQPYLSDKRIIFIDNNENHGLGYTRNVGIKKANGKYITFVDSDDWVDLDLYSSMINNMNDNLADVSVCGIKNERNNSVSSSIRYKYDFVNCISSKKALSLLTKSESDNNFISPVVWNKVYKTDIIKENKLFFLDNSYWEDDIFSFQVLIQSSKVNIVPNVYYHYYQREKSITNDFSKKHIDDLIDSFCFLKKYIESKEIEYDIKHYYRSYMDRCFTSLINMLSKNEPSLEKQRKYLLYLYERFSSNFSISEAIEYLDVDRIKRIFI